MITLKNLYESSRLRSLPLSVSGILVGGAIAYSHYAFRWDIFLISILTTISFQILSDYANDYGDSQKGTDNDNRLGPKRAIQTGKMTLNEMKKVIIVTSFISIILTIILIWISFGSENLLYSSLFLILGGLSIVSAIKYTVGKSAYGYSGLGDLFVFIFFGLVSVVGSYFLYTQQFSWKLLLPASAIGLLSVAVLNLNNMRDIENDKAMNKKTIPVKIGSEIAKYYHHLLIILAMILFMLYSIITFQLGIKVLYIIAFFPLIFHLLYVKKNKEAQKLDSQLKVVALSTFLLSILYFLGMIL